MHNLQEGDYRELAHMLREWLAPHAPDWTGANDADPGTTLLELFAYMTESLVASGVAIPERARLNAARLARSAHVLAGEKWQAQDSALARNRYFSGRLLSAEDFQLEQDYIRRRLRRHNRELHGAGIVRGLQVSVRPMEGGSGEQVVVQPGFAIAADGEEIEVCSETSAGLPEAGRELWVRLSRAERFTHPVRASDDEQVRFTRVEETFSLQVGGSDGEDGVLLARLIRTTVGWDVANC